jgi:1-deoxy-D-xylulose-5-phosphate synthase
LIQEVAESHRLLVSLEENVVAGGAGSAVAEHLASIGSTTPLIPLGYPDRFIEHATQAEQRDEAGLTADQIGRRIHAALESLPELTSSARMAQAKR